MSGEIIIDGKRKRSWPKELKRQIVEESNAEGVTVCEVARRYDIEPSQLFHWRKLFRDTEARSRTASVEPYNFLPMELTTEDSGASASPGSSGDDAGGAERAEIAFPNGRRLMVSPRLDRRQLEGLIGAVASAS